MPAQPPRRRILFRELALGQRFFDPISAEYFVKQSESLATMVNPTSGGTGPDEFAGDDVVGVDMD